MTISISSPSLYEVLEIEQSASVEQIESSYNRLMRQIEEAELVLYTIEANSDFESQKDQLQLAYEVLAHPDKRAAYDSECVGLENQYPSMMVPQERGGQTTTAGHVVAGESSSAGMDTSRKAISTASSGSKAEIGARAKAAADAVAQSYGLKKKSQEIREQEPVCEAPVAPYTDDEPVSLPNFADIPEPIDEELDAPIVGSEPEPVPDEPVTRASAVERIARRFKTFKAMSTSVRSYAPKSDVLEQIEPDTYFDGEVLMKLRQSSGASIDDICQITKINKRYLNAIERNDFDALPSAVYVRGFIRQYAQVLDLEPQEVANSFLELYQRHHNKG